MKTPGQCIIAGLIPIFVLCGLPSSSAARFFGEVVTIEELGFHPDTLLVPGDNFAVLVVQNREDGPVQHEVVSPSLFEAGTFIQVQGTGTVEYDGKRVSRVLLDPGQEAVIWFYAAKGKTYSFQCTLNGHSMQGVVRAD